MSSCGVYVLIKWIKSIELKPRVLKVECERRGQTILLDKDDNVTLDRQTDMSHQDKQVNGGHVDRAQMQT